MTTPQIVITVKQTGEIQVQSNVQDQIILYGMIERAKDALRDNFAKATSNSGLVQATAEALKMLEPAGR